MQRGLTYSSSDALSAEHYKLVTALEGTANQVSHDVHLHPSTQLTLAHPGYDQHPRYSARQDTHTLELLSVSRTLSLLCTRLS